MNDIPITPMNQRPVIIDGVGIYRMRNGSRARIDTVEQHGNRDVTRFNCKGNTERMFRGKLTFNAYRIWHESGMATAFEGEWDIIEKISSEVHND